VRLSALIATFLTTFLAVFFTGLSDVFFVLSDDLLLFCLMIVFDVFVL
jgi:hypothetical protein